MTASVFAPNRETSGALNSTAVSPQYRRVGFPVPANKTDCSDSHELDILMPPSCQESAQPLAEAQESESLMASSDPGQAKDAFAPEPKVRD